MKKNPTFLIEVLNFSSIAIIVLNNYNYKRKEKTKTCFFATTQKKSKVQHYI
jgi:hypothetical protein